jgi:copper(I)-binding protein
MMTYPCWGRVPFIKRPSLRPHPKTERRKKKDAAHLHSVFFVGVIVKASPKIFGKETEIVNRVFVLVLTVAFLLSACSAEKGMEINEAWMRPTAQGANGAAYFVIHNRSSEADKITSVSSDVAEAAEIHESRMNGDVMEMNQLQSVSLAANEEVTFAPGGLHIMLVNVNEELQAGDMIGITLHFKNSEDIVIRVPVRDDPAPEENH